MTTTVPYVARPPFRRSVLFGNALLGLAATLMAAHPAVAQEPADTTAPAAVSHDEAPRLPFVLGASGGWMAGRFAHPQIEGEHFSGPMISLHVGRVVGRIFVVGLEVTSASTYLHYNYATGKFGHDEPPATPPVAVTGSGVRLASGCTSCREPTGGTGGVLVTTPLHVVTVAPRVELAPMGDQGPYGILSPGVSVVQDLSSQVAPSLTGRIGYRLALTKQFGFAIEAGASGQAYAYRSALLGFGAAQVELHL